jgi:hypothetical protein
MQTDDTFSHVDGVREDREPGADNSASTDAVLSAAELTIDDPIDQNRKRPVARHRPKKSPECQESGGSVDVDGRAIPHSETTERHMEHGSLQGLAELAEVSSTAAKDEDADGEASMPVNHETFPFGNNVEPNETWNLDRLAAFVHRRLRRTAKDAWLIGKALNLAHKQLTEEREWLHWLQKARVSKSAAYRYCKLSTGYTLEEIQACPRAAVDRLLGKLKADDQAAGEKWLEV